jgi:hypothetical protein
MTLSDLASLGGFVSGVAVLISLIYLALQVRQNRQHVAAQISQSRMQYGTSRLDHYIADREILDLMLRGGQGDSNLSAAEITRYGFLVLTTVMGMEDEFRQYQAGLISEELHNGFVRRAARPFQRLGWRAMWTAQRDGFEPDFQAFVDSIVRRAVENPDLLFDAKWQGAVAAELAGQTGCP